MQSYEHHVVHESLEMRHPYIQDPFSSDVDPAQITSAVFDRMIAKFKDVLLNEELEPERLRDSLKTLNEQVHHQVSFIASLSHARSQPCRCCLGNVRHDDRPEDPADRGRAS